MRSENMDPQVVAVFDKGLSMSMEPSAKSLRAALSRFEQTFIVVDALDECSKEERKLLVSFMTGLIRSNPHGIKILLTSRPESDLENLLKGSSKFLINANDTTKDIRPYVAAVLTEHIANCAILDGMVTPELQQRLIDTIRPSRRHVSLGQVAARSYMQRAQRDVHHRLAGQATPRFG